jgi:hypothetical protein
MDLISLNRWLWGSCILIQWGFVLIGASIILIGILEVFSKLVSLIPIGFDV